MTIPGVSRSGLEVLSRSPEIIESSDIRIIAAIFRRHGLDFCLRRELTKSVD